MMDARTTLALNAARKMLTDAVDACDRARTTGNAEHAITALRGVGTHALDHELTLIRAHYASLPTERILTEVRKSA